MLLLSSIFAFLGALGLLSASTPLRNDYVRQVPGIQISWASMQTDTSVVPATTPNDAVAFDNQEVVEAPVLIAPPSSLSSSGSPSLINVTTATETFSETVTATIFQPFVTTTVSASPITVIETVTVSVSSNPSTWAAPARFTDLSSFKITNFACGKQNVQIANGLPLKISNQSLAVNLGSIAEISNLFTDDTATTLQLFYPANSVNPQNEPQGGADFYATPLSFDDASNVTLEYSVYFPADFDWVLGGKLPGLYGGHMTCSGGDDAKMCFSTRMMWRAKGQGEVYLYAPKDKQTNALCNVPPKSVCDAAYGLSIGRGSFSFTPAEWTHIRQTVVLNTPGQQDGGLTLDVNGKRIMDRSDVFYRDVPPMPTSPSSGTVPTQTGDDSNDGGLLSPLLGSILEPLGLGSAAKELSYVATDRPPLLPTPPPYSMAPTTNDAASALIYELTRSLDANNVVATVTETMQLPAITISSYVFQYPTQGAKEEQVRDVNDAKPEPIKFSGLFFSTFFGGSSDEYATPKDQYVWFKDFAITVNP